MINFTSELDQKFATPEPSQRVETPSVVTQTVTVRRPETRATHLLSHSSSWSWEQLRDYVVSKIEASSGPFPRDIPKERAIFSGFVNRWGDKAGSIAQFAFETMGGIWKGAPVSVTRFCKGSDPYFAEEIAQRLS